MKLIQTAGDPFSAPPKPFLFHKWQDNDDDDDAEDGRMEEI